MSHSSISHISSRSLYIPLLAALVVLATAGWLGSAVSGFQAGMLLLGTALGLALYHAAFGFTTAWRTFIINGRGKGLRAQMLMLAIAVVLFFPVLAQGEFAGQSVSGFVRPLGWSIVCGAFIFGLGMQLGNGCASGNLYHVGGGQLRAIPSMAGFAAGGLWATKDYEWWTNLPQLAPFSFIEHFSLLPAIGINLALFAAIALFTLWLERRRHGQIEQDNPAPHQHGYSRLLNGPWPFIWGAVALAILNFVTLISVGRPWSVAVAYPLWGAKITQALEWELDLDFWSYWMQPGRESALAEPLAADITSVMNLGIILGAILAAALAGRLSLQWRLPWQHWLAALLGGVLLGYGATIAFGCNIGAFFSGIASGSLHGWLWLAAAFTGNICGIWLRPWFKLSNTD